jgi:hypothetical protein
LFSDPPKDAADASSAADHAGDGRWRV